MSLLCKQYAAFALERNLALAALPPLKSFLLKYRPRAEALTVVHGEFYKLCLKAHHYSFASSVLREPILDISVC